MKGALVLLLLLPMGILLHSCYSVVGGNIQYPLVILPGSGGNQLEARLTGVYKPSSLLCRLSGWKREGGWFRLWFDPTVLLAPLTRCFAERMTLHYRSDIDDYRNAPGVETRVPYFGSTEGLLYLDPNLKHITGYMARLIDSLEQIGYRDGINLFGAPYDFRYGLAAPGHPSKVGSQYLTNLKQLIESASASNGFKPVILLSHSLGGLFALQLLARSPPSWRTKYVKHLVTLSAPWAGTVQAMLTFASGYTLGIPIVNPLIVRAEQRSSESNLWLLPSARVFGSRPLVTANNKNYSAGEIPEFLVDIGFEEGVYPYRTRMKPLVERLVDPGVPVTCIVGSGVDTPETLVYGSGGFDVQPEVVYGDGDGVVNMVSLLGLRSAWVDAGREDLKVVKIPGVSHSSILKDEAAVREIIREISDINDSISLMSAVQNDELRLS